VSVLPKGWSEAQLVDACQIIRGITFSSADKRLEPTPSYVACLRTANVQSEVEWGDLWYIPKDHVRKLDQWIVRDDILISTANSYELVGKVSRVTAVPVLSTLGAFISLLRAYAGVNAGFLYYQLKYERTQRAIREMASTTTNISNVSGAKLQTLPLLFAPEAEQSRIVDKLEELLSELDAGEAELKAAQKKLTQYRQSLLKAAVEGALTASWREQQRAQHPPAESGAQLLQRILTERRARWEAKQLAKFEAQGKAPHKDWQKKYPEPVQPDTTDLPSLPQGWTWLQVGAAGEVQLGRQRAPQFHDGDNMVPYLRVANVFEDRIDISDVMAMHFSPEDETTFRLSPGDILLNEGQSLELVGRPALYRGELPRACFTNTLVRFKAATDLVPEFALAVFRHYMHAGRFRQIAKITTNIAHLGAGRFAELAFPLPGLSEQREIVRLLSEQFEQIEAQATLIARALSQSTAQRQNILRAAFSGQLVQQDPSDEPAAELLARIRAERAVQAPARKPRGRQREAA